MSISQPFIGAVLNAHAILEPPTLAKAHAIFYKQKIQLKSYVAKVVNVLQIFRSFFLDHFFEIGLLGF